MKLLQQLVPMMNWMGNQMWIQMMMLMDVVMMAEVSVVIPFVVLVQYYDYFENDAAFERNYCCSMSFDCLHFHCLLLDFRTFCTKFQITTYKKKNNNRINIQFRYQLTEQRTASKPFCDQQKITRNFS